MKNAFREKVQTLATQTSELLKRAKALDSMLDPHLDDESADNEIAVITCGVNELENSPKVEITSSTDTPIYREDSRKARSTYCDYRSTPNTNKFSSYL